MPVSGEFTGHLVRANIDELQQLGLEFSQIDPGCVLDLFEAAAGVDVCKCRGDIEFIEIYFFVVGGQLESDDEGFGKGNFFSIDCAGQSG